MEINFQWKSSKQPASPRTMAILGLIFSVLALVFLLGAAIDAIVVDHFLQNAAHTTGTVVDLAENHDSKNNSITYAPVFTFTTDNGLTESTTSGISSSPAAFSVGDQVRIVYSRDDPAGAKIDSFWQLWFVPVFLAIFGSAVAIIGVALLHFGRRKFRQQNALLPAR